MKIILALPLSFALAACGGNGSTNSLTSSTLGFNVYAVGFSEAPDSGKRIAMYWHNGTSIALTDGSSDSGANAVSVDGAGNVYVAGSTVVGNSNTAILWKNGIPTSLAGGQSAQALYLDSTGNVFVVGSGSNGAVYWKNGVATSISGGTKATGISLDASGNVFILGSTSPGWLLGKMGFKHRYLPRTAILTKMCPQLLSTRQIMFS